MCTPSYASHRKADHCESVSAPTPPPADLIRASPRIAIMRLRSLLLPTVAAIVVAAVALLARHQAPGQASKAPTSTAVQAGHVTVAISNYAFVPKTIAVKAGTRVSFTNHDATAHTATADHGGFDTGTVDPHALRTIDFTHPGTFTYHCAFHAFMTATITVKP